MNIRQATVEDASDLQKINDEYFDETRNYKKEIESIISKSVKSYRNINKKMDFIFRIGDFFPLFKINYSDKTAKVWFTKR